MKRVKNYLNGMKSRYSMLMACVALCMGVASCSSDDFLETNAPNEPQALSDAEKVEYWLNKIPKTRAGAPFPVTMITTKTTVTLNITANDDMVIHWDNSATTPVIKNTRKTYTHTYSTPSPHGYGIFLEGSNQAITRLDTRYNGLLFLDVTNNTQLQSLYCGNNSLSVLDLTGCSNLELIWAVHNQLPSIDITHLPYLEALSLNDNELTSIDVSCNPALHTLWVARNKITSLDLTHNSNLKNIDIRSLSIDTINNLPISSTSFSVFSQLEQLDISYTPFTALALSSNPLIHGIDIEGTSISQLNISHLQIESLTATNSNLTNLTYTPNSLLELRDLRINGTPFELLSSNMYPLISSGLPFRHNPNKYGNIVQGHLYTTASSLVSPFLSLLTAKNWVVNQ